VDLNYQPSDHASLAIWVRVHAGFRQEKCHPKRSLTPPPRTVNPPSYHLRTR
jgi:hypothetical protein